MSNDMFIKKLNRQSSKTLIDIILNQREALEQIKCRPNFLTERDTDLEESLIVNWTRDSAEFMYLRSTNRASNMANDTLQTTDKMLGEM